MNTSSFSKSPRILLGSDNRKLIPAVSSALIEAGFNVDVANNYADMEALWRESRHEVVLFEVSHPSSAEDAVASALRIKRQHAQQFIGYLADADLYMSGLAGDAIFPRDVRSLPHELREAITGIT